MNETKQAWKDVADILQKSGWLASENFDAAPSDSGCPSVLQPPPNKKEPAIYRWLPAAAVAALLVCFLAFFFSVSAQRKASDEKTSIVAREQIPQMEHQLKTLEEARDNVTRSLRRLKEDSGTSTPPSGNNDPQTLKKQIHELHKAIHNVEKELEAALTAQQELFNVLRAEKRAQLDTLKNRVKQDRD